MSATTEKTASATAIRPFTVPVTSETELEALRARITATRGNHSAPCQEPGLFSTKLLAAFRSLR
jgi:hypothetical protein